VFYIIIVKDVIINARRKVEIRVFKIAQYPERQTRRPFQSFYPVICCQSIKSCVLPRDIPAPNRPDNSILKGAEVLPSAIPNNAVSRGQSYQNPQATISYQRFFHMKILPSAASGLRSTVRGRTKPVFQASIPKPSGFKLIFV
jgi:hypothetical protein